MGRGETPGIRRSVSDVSGLSYFKSSFGIGNTTWSLQLGFLSTQLLLPLMSFAPVIFAFESSFPHCSLLFADLLWAFHRGCQK